MKQAENKKYKFESPVDWYIAGIMLRFEFEGENKENPNRRSTGWENQHLIKAENPDAAYKKAIKIGKESESEYINTSGYKVRMIFEGLTTLIAVYENLEDGAEIIWIEHENKAVKSIIKRVKGKEDLEVFQKD